MIQQGMTILYVADQQAARKFYHSVFGFEPKLDVPGMTEFQLCDGFVLGLMPQKGIEQLFGAELFSNRQGKAPKAELYLHVNDARAYLERAVGSGAEKVLDVGVMDWGDRVGYCLDPDGHVLAFAEPL